MNDTVVSDGTALSDIVAREFPAARETTYLSTCTRGLLPHSARQALEAHLDGLASGRTDKAALFDMVESVRQRFAAFIGAAGDEIGYTKNVSEGLNIIAAGLDWRAGDNVVVTFNVEHPNNVYPWLNQRARHGIEVRTVADRDGHIDIDAMLAAIDPRTRLVTLPTVTFSPGFRADVRRVGEICRERGIFLLVDAVQSVGVLHTDVDALLIDGLATSTQKGLCGLYGMGFVYCRRAWAQSMQPAYLARFGVDLGEDAHEAQLGDGNYALAAAARRFDVGNYNYPALVVADRALAVLDGADTRRIEAHVLALSRRLVEGLLALGLPVAGGPPGPHSSHIVCVGRRGEGHDSTDDPAMASLSRHLAAHDVQHTIRRGMLRFALHLYNTLDDVERVLELAASWRAAEAR